MSDETLPTCDCGNVWGSHPPDCPVSRQFDHLRVENKALKERKAEYHRLWNVAEARCDRLEAALRDSLHMPVGSDASISAMGLHREFSAALAGTTEPAKPESAEVRWVLDGKVYARPSVTDLLTEAEHNLEEQGEVGFYSNDSRIQSGTGFARVRELLSTTPVKLPGDCPSCSGGKIWDYWTGSSNDCETCDGTGKRTAAPGVGS